MKARNSSGMDASIKYVREKRIAFLLNDLVQHLVCVTPADPLDELIKFLQRRSLQRLPSEIHDDAVNISGATSAASETPPPPTKVSAPARSAAGDDFDQLMMELLTNEHHFVQQLRAARDAAASSNSELARAEEQSRELLAMLHDSNSTSSILDISSGRSVDVKRQNSSSRALGYVRQLENELRGALSGNVTNDGPPAWRQAAATQQQLLSLASSSADTQLSIERSAHPRDLSPVSTALTVEEIVGRVRRSSAGTEVNHLLEEICSREAQMTLQLCSLLSQEGATPLAPPVQQALQQQLTLLQAAARISNCQRALGTHVAS